MTHLPQRINNLAGHDSESAAQHWPLRGFALASFSFSGVVFVILAVSGAGLMIAPAWTSQPATLLPGVVLLGVAALVGTQLLRCAVVVTLYADGTLILRQLHRAVRTHSLRVQRASLSMLNRSGRLTPIVVKTADGSVLLSHGRYDVDEIMTAVRRQNAHVELDI
jgi:hypothetical protein